MVVLDSGYDVCRLAFVLADLPVQLIGRLRADRVLLGAVAPPAPDGRRPTGLPLRHGAVMTLADPASWPEPTTSLVDRDRPLRHRGGRLLGSDASAAGPPRCLGRPSRPGADCGGHADPTTGRPPARAARRQAGVAVDAGGRRRCLGDHWLLEGVSAPL